MDTQIPHKHSEYQLVARAASLPRNTAQEFARKYEAAHDLGQILSGPSFSIVEMRRYPLGDNRFEYRIVLLHSATDSDPASLHFSRATRGPQCSTLFACACLDWYNQDGTVCVSVTLELLPPMEHTEHLGLPWEK